MNDPVSIYDRAESLALGNLPNRAIQAFSPAAFAEYGYPFKVRHTSELWRYVDVMHEGRFERNLLLLKETTNEEIALAKWAAEGIHSYALSMFSRHFSGRNCVTRAIHQLRGICALSAAQRLAVLELGPGSGCLTLLLSKVGHSVDTVEASQAFALHQAELFNFVLADKFTRFDQATEFQTDTDSFAAGHIRQMPWWNFASDQSAIGRYDVVTANHAFAEFHEDALHYVLRRFGPDHKHLYGETPIIIAEGLGRSFQPYPNVLQQFNESGWVYTVNKTFYTFMYDPLGAKYQLLDELSRARYERSWRRKLKRRTYLLLQAMKKTGFKKPKSSEHDSISRLRDIFNKEVPDEIIPDERFLISPTRLKRHDY